MERTSEINVALITHQLGARTASCGVHGGVNHGEGHRIGSSADRRAATRLPTGACPIARRLHHRVKSPSHTPPQATQRRKAASPPPAPPCSPSSESDASPAAAAASPAVQALRRAGRQLERRRRQERRLLCRGLRLCRRLRRTLSNALLLLLLLLAPPLVVDFCACVDQRAAAVGAMPLAVSHGERLRLQRRAGPQAAPLALGLGGLLRHDSGTHRRRRLLVVGALTGAVDARSGRRLEGGLPRRVEELTAPVAAGLLGWAGATSSANWTIASGSSCSGVSCDEGRSEGPVLQCARSTA